MNPICQTDMILEFKDVKGVDHKRSFTKIKNELLKDLKGMILYRRDVDGNRAKSNAESTAIAKGTNHWMFDTGAYVENAFIGKSDNVSASVELSDEGHPKKPDGWAYKDIGLFHSQTNCPQFGLSKAILNRAKIYLLWLSMDVRQAIKKALFKHGRL